MNRAGARDGTAAGATWGIVIPVKRLGTAKSRLALPADARGGGALPPDARASLALAVAIDTIEAVLAAARVDRLVVVTSEVRLRDELGSRGRLAVVGDPGSGLAGAIERGRQVLAELGGPAGILLGDLPALRPGELDAALAAASEHTRAMVPDADGTGTTLLTAAHPADLRPRFGPGSRRAHEDAGHRVLADAGPGLRRDVDTAADLEVAVRLGVGARTARVLAELTVGLGVPPGPSRVRRSPAG